MVGSCFSGLCRGRAEFGKDLFLAMKLRKENKNSRRKPSSDFSFRMKSKPTPAKPNSPKAQPQIAHRRSRAEHTAPLESSYAL